MANQFHIHIDALKISDSFRAELIDRAGFYESDFAGHPEGAEGFEPPHHLTKKTTSGKEFREIFDRVKEAAAKDGAMTGYIEGEFLPADEDLPQLDFDPAVAPPVTGLTLGTLSEGAFRESEIHIVMDADRSDPRLINYLSKSGLFSAYMNKPYGKAVVFTAGGCQRDVTLLFDSLRNYLRRAGGSVHGSIKEERIVSYWISESGLRMPPVVSAIGWNEENAQPLR